MTQSAKNNTVPIVTDVVVPGDPDIIRKANEDRNNGLVTDHGALNLQKRINDIEDVIGQTEVLSPSRAHAIRAEKSSKEL